MTHKLLLPFHKKIIVINKREAKDYGFFFIHLKTLHFVASTMSINFNVAECNLGEVKLEPMQSAAVRGKPCVGGSLLQGLLQGHLYCVPATFSFAFVCHS